MGATSQVHVRSKRWQTKKKKHAMTENISGVTCIQQLKLLANCFILLLLLFLMSELRSTYGLQTPTDMWSLPQDVTIVTAPLRLEEWFLFRCAWWGLCSGQMGGGCDTISLINILYGPPGLWRWPGQMNEVSLVDLFLHAVPRGTLQGTITPSTNQFIISIYRCVKSV